MPARLGVDTFVTLAGLWGLIAPKHFDDMATTRPSDFPEERFWTIKCMPDRRFG